jgi:formamidopyrimidine-DNA glycosylase
MPELPEVETVVRDLRPLVSGRTIRGVRQSEQKLRSAWDGSWNSAAAGTTIVAVRRRGKWIIIDLGTPRLIIHLGMTGQLTAVPAATPEPDHLHLVFELDDGTELRFRDIRRFGSASLHADEAEVDAFFEANQLGPEPFGLDAEYFRRGVRGTTRNLKAILLDQSFIAGVGNIYADEACFRARLHPGRTGNSLKPAEADRLREAVEAVLTRAIASRGSSIRDYVGGSGLRGGFQNEFTVYGREGEPCPSCSTTIQNLRLAGRSSHFCSRCQPLPRKKQPAGREPSNGAAAGSRKPPPVRARRSNEKK